MRRRFSNVSLAIGLAVGLLAVWMGTTPVDGEPSSVVGGVASFAETTINGLYVATRTANCYIASSATYQSCGGYEYETCTGGYIYVAECASTGYQIRGLSGRPCIGGGLCQTVNNASTSD